ncbi:MAG: peptidase [Hyphomicrobiales bacterium]|nr:peptidase [Hyphomicrobiales bacterium]
MSEALDLRLLTKVLEDEGSPWEMDESTSMARMNEDQRRMRLGFTPPPGETSLQEAVKLAAAAEPVSAAEAASESITAPSAYDLRNVGGKNYTTRVKNQGSCGSCVAFGSNAVIETTLKRSRNNANLAIDLSEAHMFYCHAAEEGRNCGNGWWPHNAFIKAKDKGVTFDTFFPYTAGDQACNLASGWQNNLARISGDTKMNSRAQIKEWISTRGSLTGCFIVYQDFFSYRSGVYRHVTGDSAGGHCVEIIGYSDAQGCWICKNSWGTDWGEGGYFRIAYGQANIETWAGPYGVNSVSLKAWNSNKKVTALWSNSSDGNAYIYLSGVGWRRVSTANAATHHAMLAELIAAKAANRSVNTLEENNQILEVYVL